MDNKQFEQLMHGLNAIADLLETLVEEGRIQHNEVKGELQEIYYKPSCTP